MTTQKSQVLQHLRERGNITTLIATSRYRIFRLSERIRELERDGYYILHAPVLRKGRRFMSYSLIGEKKRRRAA